MCLVCRYRTLCLPFAHNASDFDAKLTDPIDSCSYEYLSNGSLISSNFPPRSPWFPGSRNRRCCKGTKIRHHLGAKRLPRSMIGNKVAYDCVFCSRPETVTSAAVVTRFPTQQATSSGYHRVLNNELSLSIGKPLAKSSKTRPPLRLTGCDLIM